MDGLSNQLPPSLFPAQLQRVRAAEAQLEAKVQAGLQMPDFIQGLIDSGRFREID